MTAETVKHSHTTTLFKDTIVDRDQVSLSA
jgi:hypothetical protein